MPIIEVSDKPRQVQVVSNSYVCPKCFHFCMERKAWFPAGGPAKYFRQHGKMPECKVWCVNGCNERFPDWGWRDITDDMFRHQHICRPPGE